MSRLVYTDGSCYGNPGPGGWAFVSFEEGKEWRVSGGEKDTTNNRMELMAATSAIDFDSKNSGWNDITVITDSKYVINCATGLFKRKKNKDMWEEYDRVSKDKNITWIHVKGHSGDKYNEIVDKLAKEYVKNHYLN